MIDRLGEKNKGREKKEEPEIQGEKIRMREKRTTDR